MSEKKKFDPAASRNLKIIAVAMAMALAASIMIFSHLNKKKDESGAAAIPQDSNIVSNNSAAPDGHDNIAAPAGISNMVVDSNNAAAAAAKANGGSFVPEFTAPITSEKEKQRNMPRTENSRTSPQADNKSGAMPTYQSNVAPVPTPAESSVIKQQDDSMRQKMAQYQQLVSAWTYGDQSIIHNDTTNTASTSKPTQNQAASSATPSSAQGKKILLHAGESVYASIDMSIDTDQPSAVFATIQSGALNGATLIGTAKQNPDDSVAVAFSKLSIPGKPAISIQAEAIDGSTGRGALTGDVNHKIVQRFILPMVSAAMGAYGQVQSQQGTTITASPLVGATTSTNLSPAQIGAVAIGAGAQNLATKLNTISNATNPETTLPANIGVEVKFLSDVMQ